MHAREVAAPKTHNFERTLPHPESELIVQALKDPYIFDSGCCTRRWERKLSGTEITGRRGCTRSAQKPLIPCNKTINPLQYQFTLSVSWWWRKTRRGVLNLLPTRTAGLLCIGAYLSVLGCWIRPARRDVTAFMATTPVVGSLSTGSQGRVRALISARVVNDDGGSKP